MAYQKKKLEQLKKKLDDIEKETETITQASPSSFNSLEFEDLQRRIG